MRRPHLPFTLVLALALAGCMSHPATTQSSVQTGQTAADGHSAHGTSSASSANATTIVGRVTAPAGIVAQGGGNIVAQGGGNIVAQGGGNLRAARTVLAADASVGSAESPLANTEVFLADPTGAPYPAIAPVHTDAHGHYQFHNIPAGYTYLVVARAREGNGKNVQLSTLAAAGPAGAAAVDLDVGSTLVTDSVVKTTAHELGKLDVTTFRKAIKQADRTLLTSEVPDLADSGAVSACVTELESSLTDLKSEIESLQGQIADLKSQIADLNAQLAAMQADANGADDSGDSSSQDDASASPAADVKGAPVAIKLHLIAEPGATQAAAGQLIDVIANDLPFDVPDQQVTVGADGTFAFTVPRQTNATAVYSVEVDDHQGSYVDYVDIAVAPDGTFKVLEQSPDTFIFSLDGTAPVDLSSSSSEGTESSN